MGQAVPVSQKQNDNFDDDAQGAVWESREGLWESTSAGEGKTGEREHPCHDKAGAVGSQWESSSKHLAETDGPGNFHPESFWAKARLASPGAD